MRELVRAAVAASARQVDPHLTPAFLDLNAQLAGLRAGVLRRELVRAGAALGGPELAALYHGYLIRARGHPVEGGVGGRPERAVSLRKAFGGGPALGLLVLPGEEDLGPDDRRAVEIDIPPDGERLLLDDLPTLLCGRGHAQII